MGLAACSLAPQPKSPAAGRGPATTLPATTAPPASPAAPGSPAPPASNAASYLRIDPAESTLRILAFRAGTLARLGHDHVIEGHGLSGWVDPQASGSQQLVDLVIPVESFDIDPEASRAAEGAEFAEQISADAKAGTRHNMLGDGLLDAARFPEIEVRGFAADVAGNPTAAFSDAKTAETLSATLAATLTVAVAGHESRQTVEIQELLEPGRLTLSADFGLRQSALGLKPFSVMMGALQVEDEMHVRVRIVAPRTQASANSAPMKIAVPSGAM